MTRLLPLFVLFFCVVQASGQQVRQAGLAGFQRSLDSLALSPFLQHGTLAVSIRSTRSGQPVLSYNERRGMAPASTMKLITTATALVSLNENFTYRTLLGIEGLVRRDTLWGNVWVRGTGDPSLGSDRHVPTLVPLLSRWRDALRRLGIRHVSGAIIADGSFFDENYAPGGWPWEDLGNYYGAGVSGLNWNENLFKVIFRPARSLEQPATVLRTEPDVAPYKLLNRVRTDVPGSGDQVMIYSAPFSDYIYLDGYVPRGPSEFSVRGSLPDPPMSLAIALRNFLARSGISTTQAATTTFRLQREKRFTLPPRLDTLLTTTSPPLRLLATDCNFESINLYAEAFLRTVGVMLSFGNTNKAGLDAMKAIWAQKGLPLPGFRPRDGSGLSPQSSLTADNMTTILAAMAAEPSFKSYYASIPVMGETGTVKALGRHSRAAGNVHAKSGTIGGVKAYAGYFTGRSGELFSFCFFLNNYESELGSPTRELEKLMIRLVEL